MARIAKADYFGGVFLTTILKSSNAVPMLCDASGEIKRVVFDTDMGDFNVYVKYSTSRKTGWDYNFAPKKKRTYWNVNFGENEYDYLKDDFQLDGKKNLLAMVCTDKSLSESWIAILDLEQTLACLKLATDGGNRTITVSRTGRSHTFDCSGVAMAPLSYHPYVNHLRFFDAQATDAGVL